jgi:hypothetical protein
VHGRFRAGLSVARCARGGQRIDRLKLSLMADISPAFTTRSGLVKQTLQAGLEETQAEVCRGVRAVLDQSSLRLVRRNIVNTPSRPPLSVMQRPRERSDQARHRRHRGERIFACASGDPRTCGCDQRRQPLRGRVPGSRRIFRFNWPCKPADYHATWAVPCATAADAMRSGWVKISKPSERAMATSVMPAASAILTASAVGAETATMTGAPIAAVF